MENPKVTKSGNAPIIKVGQTAGQYGNDPNFQGKGVQKTARDLSPK